MDVDGLGKMVDIPLPKNELDDQKQKKENAVHEERARTIKDIDQQIRENNLNDSGDSPFQQPNSDQNMKQSQKGDVSSGGRGVGMSLSDPYNRDVSTHIGKKSLDEYQRIVSHNAMQIRQLEVYLQRFKEKQFKMSNTVSNNHEVLPEDSISERLNSSYLKDLIVRKKAGLDISRTDRKVFRSNDERKKTPVPIDIVIGIDASGSMRGSPMNNAITSACILYEAAKRNKMNVFINLLYDDFCTEVANPETPHSEIASQIASIVPSGGSNFMQDGLLKMLEQIGTQKKLKQEDLVGDSHIFIITDGGFYGENKMVSDFVKKLPSITLDFCIIGDDPSPIEDLIRSGEKRVGKVNVENSSEVAEKMVSLLRARLNQKTLDAQTYQKKKRQIDRFKKGY